ncbi:hypothetical protein [Alkalicoccus chagannorensis]|uniref:hypothetical protein n=1 Tax=Alkalicoccus chagannorensis TaxID=427072 RepID=UPI0003FAB544|nr:hypothetical protein [Alkalicoccus chagannorensis]
MEEDKHQIRERGRWAAQSMSDREKNRIIFHSARLLNQGRTAEVQQKWRDICISSGISMPPELTGPPETTRLRSFLEGASQRMPQEKEDGGHE